MNVLFSLSLNECLHINNLKFAYFLFQVHKHMTVDELRSTFHVDHHDLGKKTIND